MAIELNHKSSVDEIRRRFDNDVERFSNLETGQEAAMDARLMMDLVAEAASVCCPDAQHALDIGCGAGNYTLRLLQSIPSLYCDLIDLSAPMLARAAQRLDRAAARRVQTYQGDIRDIRLPRDRYDIIVAAAVLHHLRDAADWQRTFERLFAWCAPGGAIWIVDLVRHERADIQTLMEAKYGHYLEQIGGKDYRDKVFAVIAREDSPRTLGFQLNLLKKVGFRQIEVLHKNACYAAFGGLKPLPAARGKT